uniref:HMG box domain-containing protein n=1 Tax=Bursaphelenchus xylophilus TaxID=6326 RepID=A0A1I7SR90_BURXY
MVLIYHHLITASYIINPVQQGGTNPTPYQVVPVPQTISDGPKPIHSIRGKTSPYGFFVKMCYEEHKRKFPHENVLVTEISKKCSEKWKTMNEIEKKRFFDLAQKDAERYHAEITASGGFQQLRKKKRAKKDPNAPKRALSAFFFFSNEQRNKIQSQYPSWKVGQIAQELGRAWKALSEEERMVYEKKAVDDKERYNMEMKSYREGPIPKISPPQPEKPLEYQPVSSTYQQQVAQYQQNQQPIQIQYVDQDGNIVKVVTQPAHMAQNDSQNYMGMNNSCHNQQNGSYHG